MVSLAVSGSGGWEVWTCITVEVAGQAAPGLFTLSWEDLSVYTVGIPMQVTRTYDSRKRGQEGDFGYGWTLDMASIETQKGLTEGEYGWTLVGCGMFCYEAEADEDRLVVVDLGAGIREYFMFTPTVYWPGTYLEVEYTAVSTPGATIYPTGGWGPTLYYNGGELLDLGVVDIYDPEQYEITWPDGTVIVAGEDGLESITDPHGNSLTVSDDDIVHSAGQTIEFVRSGGLITEMIDPDGNSLTYEYDSDDNLISVTDREGAVTEFIYSDRFDHLLEKVIAPDGTVVTRNVYDDDGKLIEQCDQDGVCVEFDHDLANQTETITDRTGRATTLTYDDEGSILTEEDALGHTTTHTYDGDGNRDSTTDPSGALTEWTHNDRGNVTGETVYVAGQPITTTISYDDYQNMTYVSNGEGEGLTMTRGVGGVLTGMTNHDGAAESYDHDGNGNITLFTDADGHETTYTWHASGHLDTLTDAVGNVTEYSWDDLGRMTEKVVASGAADEATTSLSYTANSKLDEVLDPEGHDTTYGWSLLGQLENVTDARGMTTEWGYDIHGNRIVESYADGSERTWDYDAEGRLTSTVDEEGRETTRSYDGAGRLESLTRPDGAELSYAYDDAGRLLEVSDDDGRTVTMVRDERDLVTQVDTGSVVFDYGYDDAKRLVSVTDGLGNVTELDYDPAGRLVALTYAAGQPEETVVALDHTDRSLPSSFEDRMGRIFTPLYDAAGRLTSVDDALGHTWTFDRDGRGNVISIEDPEGRLTELDLDLNDRLIERSWPSGASESFVRDEVGQVTEHTDAEGGITSWTYDERGRVTQKVLPSSAQFDLTYLDDGRRSTVTDARGTTAYSYDAAGRIEGITQPDGASVEYAWDGGGLLTELTVDAGDGAHTTSYAYDDEAYLTTLTDPEGGQTTFTWDAVGALVSVEHANGATSSLDRDGQGRITGIEHLDPLDVPLLAWDYTWTGGEMIGIDELDGTTEDFDFDAAGKLTVAQRVGTDDYSDDFAWDGAGNVTSALRDGVAETWTLDADGRLTARGSVTYTWDDQGRMTGRDDGDAVSLSWDGQVLDGATGDLPADLELQYDYDGLLVSRTSGGTEIRYLWDRSRVLPRLVATYTPAGVLLQLFVWAEDELLQIHDGGTVRTVHRDRVRSVRGLSDSSGALTDSWNHDAFGALVGRTGSTVQPFGFGGMVLDDDLGLYYVQARWYDPYAGRFVSRDPVPGDPSFPLTLHPWVFGRGDPVHYLDPSGQMTLISMSSAIAIVTILHTAIDVTFALGALQRVMRIIYGQLGYEPLKWTGPFLDGTVGAGLFALKGWIYSPSATNDQGSTSAEVDFLLGGVSCGSSSVSINVSNQVFETWNYGQQHLHPEWPLVSKPNPYPLDGNVIFSSVFGARAAYVVSCSGIGQTTVFNGIAMTAAAWSDPDCNANSVGVGGSGSLFSWSLFDLFIGASTVTSHTGP